MMNERSKQFLAIAAVALAAYAGSAGPALADGDGGDSSMNPFTGDSWAAFEGHGRTRNGTVFGPYGSTPRTAQAARPESSAAPWERNEIAQAEQSGKLRRYSITPPDKFDDAASQ